MHLSKEQEIRDGVYAILYYQGVPHAMKTNEQDNGFKFEYPYKLMADGSKKGVDLIDYSPGHAQLEFPGGGVEEGESLADALLRETYEELRELLQTAMVYDEELFARIFNTLNIVSQQAEEIKNYLVYQYKLNQETGLKELRGKYKVNQFFIELSDEQYDYLHSNQVIVPLHEAIENGMTFRPYVHGLIHLMDLMANIKIPEREHAETNYLN